MFARPSTAYFLCTAIALLFATAGAAQQPNSQIEQPVPVAPPGTVTAPPPTPPDPAADPSASATPSAATPSAASLAPLLTPAPATRIALVVPAGFTPSTSFRGFENRSLNASIEIQERPAAEYPNLAQTLTDQELARRNILMATEGKLERTDQHLYVQARQKLPAGSFARYFLLFRGADSAVLISINAPVDVIEKGQLKKQDIDTALTSASLTGAMAQAAITAGFGDTGSFQEVPGFDPSIRLFTRDGTRAALERPGTSAGPYLLVQTSTDARRIQRNVDSLLAIAAPLVRSRTPGVDNVTIAGVGRGKVGNLDDRKHFVLIHDATAQAQQTGEPMLIRQWFIWRAAGGWSRILLVAPVKGATEMQPEIQKIIASYRD